MSTTEAHTASPDPMPSATKAAQVRLDRVTPSHCRVVLDNPPLNLMGPEFVAQIREIVTTLENDDRVKVVVFESAVDGFFLNHSDFLANFEDLTSIPQGPTGLEAWPDVLVRLTRAPFVSIALIRGRATGNGSELALACDMSFASRESALLSQFEVGVGLVAGGGPMARLPRVMGRGRALEVLLSSDDIRGADAERLGYVNRALPDTELDNFVNALATRIASFDKWAIANTKRLVNEASLPPDVEIRAGWDACMASVKRPAAQERIKSASGARAPDGWRLGRSTRVLRGTAGPQRRGLKSEPPFLKGSTPPWTCSRSRRKSLTASRPSRPNKTSRSRLPSSTSTATSFSPTA
jgi:enoyl-CoA hydratase/carnithine racemase